MDKLVTVIIPIYNMEAYLARCLDSVLNNTYKNLEIICVDDGSTDSSAKILRAYAEKDSRIVPIFKENGGVSSARNAGLDRMTGDFVTFIDSDDFVHPQYIEAMCFAMMKTDADLVITEPTMVFSEALPGAMEPISVSSLEFKTATRSQVYRNRKLRSYCACKLVKTSAIASCRFLLDYKISEDILFFASIWENNPDLRCCIFSGTLYFYYQGNPNSAVSNSNEHEMLRASKYCVDKCSISRENEQIYLFMATDQCLWHRYYGSVIKGDRSIRKEANPLLLRCWKRMIVSADYTLREKISLSIKIFLPPLYRLYQRRNRGYREWEQSEMNKYKHKET